MSLSDRITFTPLSNNRFRCNWNGVVINRRQTQAAFNRRWSELHPNETPYLPVEVQAPKAYRVESAEISRDGNYVGCPYCSTKTWGSRKNPLFPGKMRCNSCHKEFNAAWSKPLPTANWQPIFGSPYYGSTHCPLCGFCNSFCRSGEIRCEECDSLFFAVKT